MAKYIFGNIMWLVFCIAVLINSAIQNSQTDVIEPTPTPVPTETPNQIHIYYNGDIYCGANTLPRTIQLPNGDKIYLSEHER